MSWAERRRAALARIPAGHTIVGDYYTIAPPRHSFLHRRGKQYFVDGKPVTLKQAFRWFISAMDAEGSNSDDIGPLLRKVAKMLK